MTVRAPPPPVRDRDRRAQRATAPHDGGARVSASPRRHRRAGGRRRWPAPERQSRRASAFGGRRCGRARLARASAGDACEIGSGPRSRASTEPRHLGRGRRSTPIREPPGTSPRPDRQHRRADHSDGSHTTPRAPRAAGTGSRARADRCAHIAAAPRPRRPRSHHLLVSTQCPVTKFRKRSPFRGGSRSGTATVCPTLAGTRLAVAQAACVESVAVRRCQHGSADVPSAAPQAVNVAVNSLPLGRHVRCRTREDAGQSTLPS